MRLSWIAFPNLLSARKEYITDNTFVSICAGRVLCKKLSKVSRFIASMLPRAIFKSWQQCCKTNNEPRKSTVARADGMDGTRQRDNMTSSVVEGADGPDGTRDHVWHSVFGLCKMNHLQAFLSLRKQTRSHRQLVNGLIKLERNLWISDKADMLDAAFQSGDMHAMYSQLGALTKYAKSKSSTQKICRVSNAEGIPTQSYSEEKTAFRNHFSKTKSAKTLTDGEVIQLSGDQRTNVMEFLVDQEICHKEEVVLHGF